MMNDSNNSDDNLSEELNSKLNIPSASYIEDISQLLSNIENGGVLGGVNNRPVRKHANQDTTSPEWFKHKKHFFIFSQSGKPIYSRYGDEVALNTFMASLSAMSSFVESQNDTLRYLVAGDFQFVFLHRPPLVLVCITKTKEPNSIIATQLEYAHSLIVSVLTQTTIKMCIEAKYDLRDLLGGTDKFIDSIIHTVDSDLSILLNSVQCLKLNSNLRNSLTNILSNHKSDQILFSILLSGNKLISLVKQKKSFQLKPQDVHVLMNSVSSTSSFKESESWIPICLPNFNDASYLHLYICYIYPDRDICILLFSAQADAFYQLSETKKAILKDIEETEGLADELKKAVQNHDYSINQTEVPHLLHFIYKCRPTQFSTYPIYSPPYSSKPEKKRLFRLYQHIVNRVNSSPQKFHKYFYHTSQHETVIVAIVGHHELYATFSPLEKKSTVFESFTLLLQWIKDNEQNLFLN
ncbi:DUF254 family protein [Tieghemostelium lacteum]|uniref:DUF254 family protein n=1 Tax=Tieghemostelium lacteum TaxID=361077 RepID=A0A151Z670_TIELA|nr:DUF254 family protein [Tieghemostelium lacteum]|eukprot:KYQ89427.1 DUF254 family protein [Tieghemostelium lacteum]